MRLLWHSNAPWAPTGYGQQTALFTPRIRGLGHDVAISAFWGLGGAPQQWRGMRVYPADEQWGNVYLPKMAEHWGNGEPCLVLALMDAWVLREQALQKLNMALWVPVDHDPIPPEVQNFFEWSGARPVAMSRHGERLFREQGYDPLYVPHAVDTAVYKPMDAGSKQVREVLGIGEDAFVVGMVANNKGSAPPRKSFPQVFEAFSRLRKDHDDAYLYLHCEMTGRYDGIDLIALAHACGIPVEAIKFTPPWMLEMGVDPSDVACLYSMMDVLANPSYGEGFGIPIVEAQACGTPVIVTDWTAMTELCGAGWLVDGDRWWDGRQRSFFKSPSVDQIHQAMLEAYEERGNRALRDKAVEFAAQYDADRVLEEYWKPVLDELDPAREPEPAKEPTVRKLNRAERRAQKKAA